MEILFLIVFGAIVVAYFMAKTFNPPISGVNAKLSSIDARLQKAEWQSEDEKTCPECAEGVKASARICRFCGYEFSAQPLAVSKSVVLISSGPHMLDVARVVRDALEIGFEEALRLVAGADRSPVVLVEDTSYQRARQLKNIIENVGAKIDLVDKP